MKNIYIFLFLSLFFLGGCNNSITGSDIEELETEANVASQYKTIHISGQTFYYDPHISGRWFEVIDIVMTESYLLGMIAEFVLGILGSLALGEIMSLICNLFFKKKRKDRMI